VIFLVICGNCSAIRARLVKARSLVQAIAP
jgi:hypothetical protein